MIRRGIKWLRGIFAEKPKLNIGPIYFFHEGEQVSVDELIRRIQRHHAQWP